jgi:hypothetical protein
MRVFVALYGVEGRRKVLVAVSGFVALARRKEKTKNY